MTEKSDLNTDIDFQRDGKWISILRLPCSSDSSAYGIIPIPIALIKNGTGPTVFLMAGNHGDEYEGPLALGSMIRELDPDRVSGRLIILPSANFPAVMAGRRNSPVDGRNLNRSFPGSAGGAPTAQIAHYIESVIVPMCDAWIDLHSGGASLDSIPCVNVLMSENGTLQDETKAMARAFGAPVVVIYDDIGGRRTSLATALRHEIPSINTEMGGGGSVSIPGLRMCREGVRNVLAHLGVLRSDVRPTGAKASPRFVRIEKASYAYASDSGIFEPFRELGEAVEEGQPAGCVHFIHDPGREPATIRFALSGLLCMKRPLARVEPGDCVALVCSDVEVNP